MSADLAPSGTPPEEPVSVLLVEDEPDLRILIRDVLESQGCRVDVAETAPEALRQVIRASYRVVISDIRLPRMDGLELARHLSRRVHSPQIILMTGEHDPEVVREGYDAGASHVLFKPFSLTALTRLVVPPELPQDLDLV